MGHNFSQGQLLQNKNSGPDFPRSMGLSTSEANLAARGEAAGCVLRIRADGLLP